MKLKMAGNLIEGLLSKSRKSKLLMIRINFVFEIFVLLALCDFATAQKYAAYEGYYFSPFLINPAITGSEIYPVADLCVKRQWTGFTDAPTTYRLSGNYRIGKYDFYDPKGFVNKGPLKIAERVGIGAALFRDNNGPANYTGGLISYAYHMPIGYETNLSFGMAVTGSHYGFNNSLLSPNQPNDSYLFNNDEKFGINFNLGGYLYNKKYFAGISITNILPDRSQVNDKTDFKPGFFIIGGLNLNTDNLLNFEPAVVIKKIGSDQVTADIHAKFYIKYVNWIAVSYGTSGYMSCKFALRLYRKLYAGYHYEYTLSEIAKYNSGSHEIHLGINLGLFHAESVRKIAVQKVKD